MQPGRPRHSFLITRILFNCACSQIPFGQDLQVRAVRHHALESGLDCLANRCQGRIGAIRLAARHANPLQSRLENLPASCQFELVRVLDGIISRNRGIGGVNRHLAGLQLLQGIGILGSHNHIDRLFTGCDAGLGQTLTRIIARTL